MKKINPKIFKLLTIFALITPLLICILIFTLIPIFRTFTSSLKFYPDPTNHTIHKIGIGNYKKIWNDDQFLGAIKNSTAVLFVATFISFCVAFAFALLIESMISKISKNFFLTLIFSQFFISSFAVGIAFTLFFGEKGLFFKLIGKNEYSFTSGNKRIPIWIYYSIFQIWRSLPFNIVLLASAINLADIKYKKIMINDNLSLIQRIRFIYINQVSKVFFSIIFTNFIFASLLLPDVLLDSTYDIDLWKAHTLTSYTIKYMGGGLNGSLEFEKGYTSAFFSFIYLVFIICLVQLFRPKYILKISKKIKRWYLKFKIKEAKNVIKIK